MIGTFLQTLDLIKRPYVSSVDIQIRVCTEIVVFMFACGPLLEGCIILDIPRVPAEIS